MVGMLVGVVVGAVVGEPVGDAVGVDGVPEFGGVAGGDVGEVDVAAVPGPVPEPGGSTVDPPHATTASDNANEPARDQ